MKERFLTPSQLKERLSESFPERVPPHMDFHVGYFEGKANAKCWIVSEEDTQAMYDAHFEGDGVMEGENLRIQVYHESRRRMQTILTPPYLSGNVNSRKYMMN